MFPLFAHRDVVGSKGASALFPGLGVAAHGLLGPSVSPHVVGDVRPFQPAREALVEGGEDLAVPGLRRTAMDASVELKACQCEKASVVSSSTTAPCSAQQGGTRVAESTP